MSSRSKWKATIMDAELLIAKLQKISRKKPKPLQTTKSDKRLKYPDHKRPKLKTTKTIKWKRKHPKHTPSKTNTHEKTNHACYKPQNTFSLFPLLPQRQTNLLRITQKSFPISQRRNPPVKLSNCFNRWKTKAINKSIINKLNQTQQSPQLETTKATFN